MAKSVSFKFKLDMTWQPFVWWHTSAITCQIIIHAMTCQIFMSYCQIIMSTCQKMMSTCQKMMSTCLIVYNHQFLRNYEYLEPLRNEK